MSVRLLYCEGKSKSLDLQILSALLSGITIDIQPVGSKHILKDRIIGARDAQPNWSIAGIKDRDFDDDNSPPINNPRNWKDKNTGENLGWTWERKEIENYLIDPNVVKLGLGSKAPPPDEYQQALKASAEKMSYYTAARITLSFYLQNRPSPPQNYWGEKQYKKYKDEDYYCPKDRGLTRDNCRSQTNNIVTQYQNSLGKKLDILGAFDRLLPSCRPGGFRFENYLTFFAGKDLLFGMQNALRKFNFESPVVFRQAIIQGIAESPEDVWTWLPEWQKLQELIRDSNLEPS